MIVLETDRLLLRHLIPDDLDDLAAIQADPAVMRFYPSGPRDRERTRSDLGRDIDLQRNLGLGPWATIDKGDGRLIGRCGLQPVTIGGVPETEVAYMLARSAWGRGLATEAARAIRDLAFDRHGLRRVVSVIARGNVRSVRVAVKNGMTYEEEITVEGCPCFVYSMTDVTRRSRRPRG